MFDMDVSRAFNFIVLGDVGKSHFRKTFCEDGFNLQNPVKLGIEYGYRKTHVDGEPILITVWEAASLPSFRSLAKNYYHGASAAFLLYDVTNRASFDNLSAWIEVTRWFFSGSTLFKLVAINTDSTKDVVVTTEEAKNFAKENKLDFVEIGKAEKPVVEKLVQGSAGEVWKKIQNGEINEKELINGVIRIEPRTKGIARCF